jgi:hypothetical protein
LRKTQKTENSRNFIRSLRGLSGRKTMPNKPIHGVGKPDGTGMRRRDFIVASGAAVATAAAGALGLPTRLYAQTGRTEITFASARFFSTDTMQQVIEAYNKTTNRRTPST